MIWKLIRTKAGFADDPDYVLQQSGYLLTSIFSYTGPRLNSEVAFYVAFITGTALTTTGRGEFAFTIFERAVWGNPKANEHIDIDGPSSTSVGLRRIGIEGFNLEAAVFGVRLYNIVPPSGATGLRVYAAAYTE